MEQTPARPRSRFGLPFRRVSVLLAAAALLTGAACGGGGDGIRVTPGTTTPTPTSTEAATPTGTPTPRPIPLPPLPENPFAGGVAVANYLTGSLANMEECLPELVREWGLEPESAGPRCLAVDLDGDSRDEWVFVLNLPAGGGAVGLGDAWFFEDEEANYRYFNSARGLANAATAGVEIREIRDFTRDGFPEIVITWQACADSVCTTHLLIASSHNGALENLTPEGASVESLTSFEITDAGAIRMEGGPAQAGGNGPVRPEVVTVSWAGLQFHASRTDGPPVYLIHLVNDADAAFARGEYGTARDLYIEASTNATLRDWKQETGSAPERMELRPYALFRAAIASLRAGGGDEAAMQPYLDQAADNHSGTMHGSAAGLYREALRQGNGTAVACSATESYLGTFEGLYNAFWDYGPTVPQRTIFTFCR